MPEALLMHSLAEFATVTLPALELAQARNVCEIGVEHGGNSAVLVRWLKGRGGLLTSIDPAPSAAFDDWRVEHGHQVRHLKRMSLDAIPTLMPQDAWFVDGDHNWYTVYHELKAIYDVQHASARPLLVFLHDAGWPCAKRDQYYAPERIPAEFRHPHSWDCGITLDNVDTIQGGFRGCGAFAVAVHEGGPRNGVLTAIEDFFGEHLDEMFWAFIPGAFGLGVLFSRDHPAVQGLANLVAPLHENALLKRLERNRLANYLAVIELQDRASPAGAPIPRAAKEDGISIKDLRGKFCSAPFRKFETLIDGTVAPCCSIWTDLRLGSIDNQDFAQIWNSDKAQEMRASILDGSFRHCNHDRCDFIVNDRLPDRDGIDDPQMREVIENGTTIMKTGPEWLFLAHDVTCNLACPSCRSGILAADEAQETRFNKIEEQVLRPMVRPDHPIVISVAGQGDPWSSPHYRSFLRFLAETDNNVTLNLHSNGLLMTRGRWEQFKGLGKYRPLLDVSIDACNPWTFAYIRQPGDWTKLEPNLMFFGEMRSKGMLREYHINSTVQLDNFHELGDMADLSRKIGADSLRLYLIQSTGTHIHREFAHKNVASPEHPLHTIFLEALRDVRLGQAHVHLYDIAILRNTSLKTRLPSDEFDASTDEETLLRAAHAAFEDGDALRGLAIATAVRVRFPQSLNGRMVEAEGLQSLGFPWQASYRYQEVLEIAPDYMDARVALATSLVEAGHVSEGERLLREIIGDTALPDEVRKQVGAYIGQVVESTRPCPDVTSKLVYQPRRQVAG